MAAYDTAVQELYQAPLAQFITERKRLADELRRAGDRDAAARLAKLGKPPTSAWVVNQLYWHARDAFDRMLATATRLRHGERAADVEHREAIAGLRRRATAILSDAGHPPTEATLRRVTTTLAALAAAGGFDPDPPGALAADRDPPGFEAVGIATDGPTAASHEAAKPDGHAQHAEAERRRIEAARARREAERERIEAALRTARGEVHTREREVKTAHAQLHAAEAAVAAAHETVAALERKLATFDEGN